jgi:hypothetical protein
MTLREGWLLTRLAAGATCFIGGIVAEENTENDTEKAVAGPAYGVAVPGEIHAWSAAEIG